MLKRKKFRTPKIATVIGKGTTIKGDLVFSGGIHVDGVIQGCVVADTAHASALTLSEHGRIDGDVKAPNVTLNGQVTGDVYASERVELASKAKISGAVYYNTLEMMMGAEVNGKLIHTREEKPLSVELSGDKKKGLGVPNTSPEVPNKATGIPNTATGMLNKSTGVVGPKKSQPPVTAGGVLEKTKNN